jgi:hypothetical protein
VENRLKTVMIGAIDLFQIHFKEELKEEEFYKKFLVVREKILDLGNRQIYLYNKDLGK